MDIWARNFGETVAQGLTGQAPGGYGLRTSNDHDRELGLEPRKAYDFIIATQPPEWEELEQHYRAQPWRADFAVPEAGTVRLTMLGEPGTQAYFGSGFNGRSVSPCPMVLARRKGAATRFLTCLEWREQGTEPGVQGLALTPVSVRGQELPLERALALKIERGDGTDLLMLAPEVEDEKEADGIATEAGLLFVTRRNGEVLSIEHLDTPH